jgi:hypothetical protein
MKIVIFTGAGIGVPLELPISSGFGVEIDKIKELRLNSVFDYLGQSGNDIEKVLFALEELNREDNLTLSVINNTLEKNHNGVPIPEGVRPMELLITLKYNVRTAITQIKKGIFGRLRSLNKESAFTLYYNLLKEIKNHAAGYEISFYTSNYDLSFEEAYSQNPEKWEGIGIKDINFLFSENRGKYVLTPEKLNENNDVMKYIKIHGSLDWHVDRDNNITRSCAVTTPDDPDLVPLIYPGHKGFIENEPFKSFHDRLAFDMDTAYAAIFIGFAFRDQYINFILDSALKRRTQSHSALFVQCFNPAPLSDYPLDSRLPYFAKKYSSVFFHYPEGIEIKENPFSMGESAFHQPFQNRTRSVY